MVKSGFFGGEKKKKKKKETLLIVTVIIWKQPGLLPISYRKRVSICKIDIKITTPIENIQNTRDVGLLNTETT